MTPWPAALTIIAGLMGASGVALAALSAHGGGASELLATASQFLLVHAVATLAATRAAPGRWTLAGASLIAFGASLFAAAVASLALWGARPIPMAAPTGGTLTILGWLVLAGAGVAALARKGRSGPMP